MKLHGYYVLEGVIFFCSEPVMDISVVSFAAAPTTAAAFRRTKNDFSFKFLFWSAFVKYGNKII